jgi:hypothetical protein
LLRTPRWFRANHRRTLTLDHDDDPLKNTSIPTKADFRLQERLESLENNLERRFPAFSSLAEKFGGESADRNP